MAFKLRINFSGLCMFVPRADTGEMHVLLPRATGHSHGADRHVSVLGYDTIHLREKASGSDGTVALKHFFDRAMKITGTGSAGLKICDAVVNLRPVTGKPVDADHLGSDPRGKLAARVTFSAGRMARVALGACWEWEPGKFRHLAHQVEWELDYPDSSLVLQMTAMDGTALETVGPLFPVSTSDGPVINLLVHNVPAGDLPPDPEPEAERHRPAFGAQPSHFLSFYSLFGEAVPVRLPRFWGDGDDCPDPTDSTETLCKVFTGRGGSPFNCMVASDWG